MPRERVLEKSMLAAQLEDDDDDDIYIYIYIYIYSVLSQQVPITACEVKDRRLFFQDLQVETFKFSCYLSYVWVKVVNEESTQ